MGGAKRNPPFCAEPTILCGTHHFVRNHLMHYLENFMRYYAGFRTSQPGLPSDRAEGIAGFVEDFSDSWL